MREWTREERYRNILDATESEIKELKEQVNRCPYRQKFHIQPTTGLLNDPNGFAYFNGEYHLFYQYYPDDLGYIFSGSCIYDRENVSGLGSHEHSPLF